MKLRIVINDVEHLFPDAVAQSLHELSNDVQNNLLGKLLDSTSKGLPIVGHGGPIGRVSITDLPDRYRQE